MTISQLAKAFGLSRSTLLYYDRMDLLRPSGRSRSGYRLYGEDEVERLRQICMYREMGVSLRDIANLLDGPSSRVRQILEQRLIALNAEIGALRRQQRVVVNLLRDDSVKESARVVDRDTWVAMLTAAGLDREGRHEWHKQFEARAPEAHRDLLESLGFADDEVETIRRSSRET